MAPKPILLPFHKEHRVLTGKVTSNTSPPLAFFRRKKALLFCLLSPILLLSLIYNGLVPSIHLSNSFSFSTGRESLSPHQSPPSKNLDPIHAPSAHISGLTGVVPVGYPIDPMEPAADGMIHNSLLDGLNKEGTKALSDLKAQMDSSPSSSVKSPLNHKDPLGVQPVSTITKSSLLLLHALQMPGYRVGRDWREVYLDQGGKKKNAKFERLVDEVGLTFGTNQGKGLGRRAWIKTSVLLELYRRSESKWVSLLRSRTGLTVFSKSYCPYSKATKNLLDNLGARYSVYEVDLRPDAEYLQPLLAELTGHKTFPNVLIQERTLGGNDNIQALNSQKTLKGMLKGIGAL
ncbi:hypothetical protein IE53DRAFT_387700 [Violaceomyces palustris]|uniref:Uncharacterized protein n=1 Tax=Violaceomyces palustris TaxID=1673888 RepID=A0ACD0NW29_9BASI|nr:hypothetical protein IE53DRAFT_387700 [Violaceomyces palustris]